MNKTSTLLRETGFPDNGCVSIAPAERWDDGSIAGNGIQGALAFCRTAKEELVLSHEELFLPLFPDYGYVPVKEHLEELRELVLNGKAKEAQDLILGLEAENNFPLYNTTDPFVGACSLDMLMDTAEKPDDYFRSTDFETGETLVAWKYGDAVYHRNFFVSRAKDVIVVKLTSPTNHKISVEVALREIEYVPQSHPKAQDIYSITIDKCESKAIDDYLTHRMHFKDRWENQPFYGSATVGKVISEGGRASVEGNMISIENADEVLLLIKTIPHRNGEELSLDDIKSQLDMINPDYDQLLKEHTEIHSEIFNRCSLQLSDPEEQKQITENLQAGSSIGNTDPALVEKCFEAGRYGIISSTGTMPPLLQGVWTGTWKPRWSGDYTLNGNVQSMVAASLAGNHYECQETLMDYMDSLMDDFRKNAKELLDVRGPLIPWRSSTHGRTHYLSCFGYYHFFPGIFWLPGAGWFAQIYYDYYLFTGNEEFFENRLKPFLLDSIAFYEDILVHEEDGKYVICPDSSSENDLAPEVELGINPTMTVAVIKQLLRTVLRERDKLGADETQIAKWKEMQTKMPDYAIGENGALKEWCWPGVENREKHRHVSHLYPLYYEVDPEVDASPELREACRVAIDKRIEFRRLEDGGFMAFGFTQTGMSAAYLEDLSLAYESLEYLVNSYWSPAMASMHNVKDVFNLDISGGLPAVIITMLVQSFLPEKTGGPWQIKLLPLLPPQWPKGKLKGVRCRGGFELDITWGNGKLTEVKVLSLRGEPCMITYGGKNKLLELEKGTKCLLLSELN